jgi:hypothetical protein
MTSELTQNAETEIRRQLFEYALASDTHDWDGLAELFAHGRYHFCAEPGADPVLEWGRTVIREDAQTQHVISAVTIEVEETATPPRATARNYLSLFAVDPTDGAAQLVSACWFDGSWELVEGRWRWRTHTITPLFRGNWRLLHRSQQFVAHPGTVN